LDFLTLGVLFIFISFLSDLVYIAMSLIIKDRLPASFSNHVRILSSIFILSTGIYFVFV